MIWEKRKSGLALCEDEINALDSYTLYVPLCYLDCRITLSQRTLQTYLKIMNCLFTSVVPAGIETTHCLVIWWHLNMRRDLNLTCMYVQYIFTKSLYATLLECHSLESDAVRHIYGIRYMQVRQVV